MQYVLISDCYEDRRRLCHIYFKEYSVTACIMSVKENIFSLIILLCKSQYIPTFHNSFFFFGLNSSIIV